MKIEQLLLALQNQFLLRFEISDQQIGLAKRVTEFASNKLSIAVVLANSPQAGGVREWTDFLPMPSRELTVSHIERMSCTTE